MHELEEPLLTIPPHPSHPPDVNEKDNKMRTQGSQMLRLLNTYPIMGIAYLKDWRRDDRWRDGIDRRKFELNLSDNKVRSWAMWRQWRASEELALPHFESAAELYWAVSVELLYLEPFAIVFAC
jgi:hypothetical protein